MISRIIIYQGRGLSFSPKPEMDNTNRGHDNSRYYTKTEFNIVLLYIQQLERNAFTLLKLWNFRALFRKQWSAPGLGNHSVQ
jgi:hypothetical protein